MFNSSEFKKGKERNTTHLSSPNEAPLIPQMGAGTERPELTPAQSRYRGLET